MHNKGVITHTNYSWRLEYLSSNLTTLWTAPSLDLGVCNHRSAGLPLSLVKQPIVVRLLTCGGIESVAWHLKKLSGVDRSAQTRQVHINSHAYTCIHHRIKLAVGDMTMSG